MPREVEVEVVELGRLEVQSTQMLLMVPVHLLLCPALLSHADLSLLSPRSQRLHQLPHGEGPGQEVHV